MKNQVKEYEKAIRMMLEMKSIEETSAANHAMLAQGKITQAMFSASAQIIAAAFLAR